MTFLGCTAPKTSPALHASSKSHEVSVSRLDIVMAIHKLDSLVSQGDSTGVAFNYLGLFHSQLNNRSKAKFYFDKAFKKDSTLGVALYNLGVSEYEDHKEDQAIHLFEKCCSVSTRHPYLNVGVIDMLNLYTDSVKVNYSCEK